MNTLIKGCDAICMDDAGTVLRGCDVAIEGNRIAAVDAVPPGFIPDEIIDARDRLALPGFFNAHTHAAMTLERGWAEDLPLDRWFNERIWVAESALTEEDVYWGAALAACEMIRGGTVAFADHYFWMDQVAKVAVESGLRALLAWCVFGLGAEQEIGGTTLQRTVAFVREWLGAAGGRIRTILGPHSPYICPPDFLKRVAAESGRLGVGVHIHAAESREQVTSSLAAHGKSPIAYLDSLGLFQHPSIAAHCLYLNRAEMNLLAKRPVTVAHCPKTYMKLAMGAAPVVPLLKHGAAVAIGTDGPASNNTLDMLESARLAALMQKQARRDAEALPGRAALELATRAGAQALGFGECGVLAPGRPADIILVDCRRPHWTPRHDLTANLLYSAQAGDVTHVWVDGRPLMRDRALLTLDEERIRREAERRALRIVAGRLTIVREYRG